MTSTATLYETANRPLTAVIEAAPAASWTNPSPCEGWTARDVLSHLIGTQRDFLAGRGIDLGAAPDLDVDPAASWRDHAKRVLEVVDDEAVTSAEYDGHFGPTTIGETLEDFYVFDMVVHRWDIATSVGVGTELTEAELDRIESGAAGFGEALYMDGVCKPGVEPPTDADRSQRVLAKLGRKP